MEWMQKNKIKNSHGCRFGFYGASFSKVSVLMYTLKRWIKKKKKKNTYTRILRDVHPRRQVSQAVKRLRHSQM